MTTDDFTVFYAWQSDLPSRDNRNFIESAIASALKAIQKTGSIQASPRLDKDTKGITGIPDIANTILEKIRTADMIVADVSFIGRAGTVEKDSKLLPNPNVMIELGYALSELGWERIIIILNTATGTPEDLPFDLRHRRWPFQYTVALDTDETTRAEQKKTLTKELQDAIEAIAVLPLRQKRGTTPQRLDALEAMVSTLSGSVAQYTTMANLVSGLQKVAFANVAANENGDPRVKCERALNELVKRVTAGKFHNVTLQQGMFVMSILPTFAQHPLPLFEGNNEQMLNLQLKPLATSTWNRRKYGDRLVTTSGETEKVLDAVTEITFDGCVSAASHDVISIGGQFWALANQKAPNDAVSIPSAAFEKGIIEGVFSYLKCLKALGTKGPWYVGFGMVNIKRTILFVSPRFMFGGRPFEGEEIRPPVVEIPENIELENQQSVARVLRPAFDYIWREHNYPRSLNYAESGDWIGQ